MKKKILVSIILIMFCNLIFCQSVKAETEIKTTIQINGAGSWTNISASDAYDKCQELNDDNSALGITGDNVIAHLTTNADWYAVSLLTISSYGSNDNGNTTGNSSGIQNFGTKRTFTAGLYEGYTSTNAKLQSLIDNRNTKFVEILKADANENEPGRGLIPSEILLSQGSEYYLGNERYAQEGPISTRTNLFFVAAGNNSKGCDGCERADLTFRPAIWVK